MPVTVRPSVAVRDRWIAHPGGRLFARVWTPAGGSAASRHPVVLLHDSLGCVELWRDFPERLCAAIDRSVVAYDRLGFGRSDARTERPGLDFIADEARTFFPAVREQLGIAGFVAFGHSVGGGMALHCAAAAGSGCEAVITESAQAFVEDRTVQGISAAQAQFADAGQIDRLRRYHGAKAQWVLDAWTGTWLRPDFASWSLAPVLPQVRSPVLAIHGELDDYGTARHPEAIGRGCAGPVRVEILPGVRHVPHREQPERVVELVRDFLA